MIVALDSTDKSANYIHIAVAKESTDYYCPCCKGVVRPKAIKNDKNYKKQPHYYHISGGCSDETYIHFICKTYLLEKDCKFKVNGTEYTVSYIELEKTIHTNFGNYRPDIIVHTTVDKTFFFEIKYSNHKTEIYAPKWDELGNDVVEVEARKFINSDFNCSIPEFDLIYSNGECFIKKYSRSDYDNTIGKIKKYWSSRQNRLDYIAIWIKLDWFWKYLEEYKNNEIDKNKLINSLLELQLYDIGVCWDLVFNKSSCFKDIKCDIRDAINCHCKEIFKEKLQNFKTQYSDDMKISWKCEERYGITLQITLTNDYVMLNCPITISISMYDNKWLIHPDNIISFFNLLAEKQAIINEHICNVRIIQSHFASNTFVSNSLLLLEEENIILSYKQLMKTPYLNVDEIESEIIDTLQDGVINYYKRDFIVNSYHLVDNIYAYLNEKIKNEYFGILQVEQIYGSDYNWNANGVRIFSSDGILEYKIIKREQDNRYILDLNEKYVIEVACLQMQYLYHQLDDIITKNFSMAPVIFRNREFLLDIMRYSNNHWNFDINGENGNLIISLSYYTPYLNQYQYRHEIKKEIEIPYSNFENILFCEYKMIMNNFLDNIVAPIMKNMIDTEKENYNLTHINSVLYTISEVSK